LPRAPAADPLLDGDAILGAAENVDCAIQRLQRFAIAMIVLGGKGQVKLAKAAVGLQVHRSAWEVRLEKGLVQASAFKEYMSGLKVRPCFHAAPLLPLCCAPAALLDCCRCITCTPAVAGA
jgi:hypothetical protein